VCLLEKKFCRVLVGIFFKNFVWAFCNGLELMVVLVLVVVVLIADVLATSFFLLLLVVVRVVVDVDILGFLLSAPLALSCLAFLFFVILQRVCESNLLYE